LPRPTEDADWEPFRIKEREEEEMALNEYDLDDTADSDGGGPGSSYGSDGGDGGGAGGGGGGGGGSMSASKARSAMALVSLAEKKPVRPPQPSQEEMESVLAYLREIDDAPPTNKKAKSSGLLVSQLGSTQSPLRHLQNTLVRERQLRSALVASDSSMTSSTLFFVDSRTLVGCTDPFEGVSGVPPSVPSRGR